MGLVEGNKKGSSRLQPRTTLASIESLTVPLVQEVVLLADFKCGVCQKRVAEIMSRMNGEMVSVEVSVLTKKVTLSCRYPTAQDVAIYRNPPKKFNFIMRLFRSSCN